jgi:hypothetical protein
MMNPRKVLLIELNEINWRLLDPFIAQGKLPNFERLRRTGSFGAPLATEVPPYLDPWISWVTLHTGVRREAHGASVLEQQAETIRAKRTWQYAVEAGKTVGIFGSISAYPPQPVPGFIVPGPFAPGGETYPRYLEPVQALNRHYTQVHNRLGQDESPLQMLKNGAEFLKMGLRPQTCARVAAQLVRERLRPSSHYKRVSLQPLINYDFFEVLYKRYQPEFATWHSNHCAHYMHHYWRAHDDADFLVRASSEEKRDYGKAIEHGYRVADELLGRFMKLVDDNTVIVVTSGLGQQPYVDEKFRAGRVIVRFKDIHRILDLVGAEGVTDVSPMMAPQWNVTIPDPEKRAKVARTIAEARRVDSSGTRSMMYVEETGEVLTVTPMGLSERPGAELRFTIPGRSERYTFDDLMVADQPTPKQGMHHPEGVLLLWGHGIEPGLELRDLTNLDIAPTLLSLLGVPVPAVMEGRVLSEAWGEPSATPSFSKAGAVA